MCTIKKYIKNIKQGSLCEYISKSAFLSICFFSQYHTIIFNTILSRMFKSNKFLKGCYDQDFLFLSIKTRKTVIKSRFFGLDSISSPQDVINAPFDKQRNFGKTAIMLQF